MASDRFPARRLGHRLVVAGLALVGLLLPEAAAAQASWWNPAWGRRVKLTFNNSSQPENLAGFPVLVVLNSARVDYAQTQNAGQDIRFVDADDATLLNHQIETWNEAGTSFVWVRVPQVDASSTSDFIYMYFGNASAPAPSLASQQATWDADFKLVQHLNELSPNPHRDSTSNGNDSTAVNVTTQGSAAGLVDGADLFTNAAGDNVDIGDDATLNVGAGQSFTVEAWVRTATVDFGDWQHVVDKDSGGARGWDFRIDSGNVLGFSLWDSGFTVTALAATSVTDAQWRYVVGRWNGATRTAEVFVNGNPDGSASNANVVDLTNATEVSIGEEAYSDNFHFDGRIDEVRFSRSATAPRSNNWIQAQYRSMRDQFISYGALEGSTLCGGVAGQWWDGRWTRRREITFDNAAQAENLTDFPVLIRLDSTRVDYAQTQNAGQDIRFVDSNNDTVLAHQIELWNEAGISFVWVKVPQINGSSSADSIWMYYGNNAAADGQSPAAVWSNGYESVYHLHANFADSTALHAAATNNGTTNATGLIADGDQLSGQPRYIDTGWSPSYGAGVDFTWEGWFRRNAATSNSDAILGIDDRFPDCATADCSEIRLTLRDDDSNGVWEVYDSWLRADTGGSFNATSIPLATAGDGNWHYAVIQRNGTTGRIYYDGQEVGNGAVAASAITFPANLLIGAQFDTENGGPPAIKDQFTGVLDEIRTSTVARSADWIRAQHKSMTDTFASYGPELGPCRLRSIGSLGPSSLGSVSCTQGSRVVTGTGTSWSTDNRGRGDRITINGKDYTVLAVDTNASLRLTSVFEDPTSPYGYTIARKFANFTAWEDCIDGPGGAGCEGVANASLVTDNRGEIGIAYEDSVFQSGGQVLFVGATTDAAHTITLTADGRNRHNGVPGAGVVIDGNGTNRGFRIEDNNYTVEWLEFTRIRGTNDIAAVLIRSGGTSQTGILLQNLLIHDFFDGTNDIKGIGVQGNGGKLAAIRNVMIWNGDVIGIEGDAVDDSVTIENVTVNGMSNYGIDAFHSQFVVRNTISVGNPSGDFVVLQGDGTMTGSNNTSSDTTATTGPRVTFASALPSVAAAAILAAPNADLHLLAGPNSQRDSGLDLSSSFFRDIDGQVRPGGLAWDRGADESDATTEVKLQSFTALPGDGSVLLDWRTASELDNLGFHLHRAQSPSGPWTRLTQALIPGLGSSAVGQAYSFRDAGLQNGTLYFYRLEDVDASSKSTFHGPVSAVPSAAAVDDGAGREGGRKGASSSSCPSWVLAAYGSSGGSAATGALRCTRHGDPEGVSLSELSRDARSATLELRTGGFYALHEASGTVRVFVPGFELPQDEAAAALPIRRALAEAVVGRRVQLAGVRALDVQGFRGLVPSALGKAEMEVGWDGTVRAGRRGARRTFVRRDAGRLAQDELVKLLPSQFQGEKKSAVVEISPLRYDERRRQLLLARRVRLRLLFAGREPGESGRGSVGRLPRQQRQPAVTGEVLARLFTTSRGLHAVSFEELFPGQRSGLLTSALRLERQGQAVGFHVEPSTSSFGPGSRLFFHAAEAAGSTAFSSEVAYELRSARDGVAMPLASAAPGSSSIASAPAVKRTFETNRFYQPGLLEAEDVWLGEALASGATRVQSLSLVGVDPTGSAELDVFLQGASESGRPVDHHVSVSLNGAVLGETQFAGKQPCRINLTLQASLLREGSNELSLTNVADTGVSSLVFLDRVEVRHPRLASLGAGLFEGTWSESGTATLTGASGAVALLEVSEAPRWLSGWQAAAGVLRFSAEAGRRYLAVTSEAVRAPRVEKPEPSTLRATTSRADYLLIAPRAFLSAATPLLERRQDQGLATRAVAFEEVATEFGHGQPSAEAIREFVSFAFHSWQRPSPRYVLLLGDASYDPRNFMGTSQPAPLPALWTKTSYLWTASDPLLAAVNGEDSLPDLAVGRLPATTVEQAELLVQKLLSWEDSGQGLGGAAALVADNPDLAGDFEADVEDIRASFLKDREARVLKLSELGAATRPEILDALNSGLSFLNYVGHGGAAVWASENVWNSWDAPSLQAQSQQPLLVTMNCLNGYFVAPAFESLSESLVKAEGRGAVASFSPSGLSLDGPAHQYHRALMAALTSGGHERLGDAVQAAQQAYAESGLMPELVSVYHLLGDPATPIR